jgi:hypothetical protein
MSDYKPNSHKSKVENTTRSGEEKKVEKVVRGKVKTKKKTEIRKFADVFIAEDAANVKSYILMDVLVPAVKKAISDIVQDGVSMILYGSANGGSKNRYGNASYVSYRSYSDRDRRDDNRRNDYARNRSRYDFDDIILSDRGEAEEVLTRMDELIDTYGIVSVADLYDLVGITCDYTDNKYGWTNIRNAEAIRVRDGYMLKLPKPLPIN